MAGAEPQPAPSAELLEFLGEFTDERGEWVDPLDLGESESTDDPGGGAKEPKKGEKQKDEKQEGGPR